MDQDRINELNGIAGRLYSEDVEWSAEHDLWRIPFDDGDWIPWSPATDMNQCHELSFELGIELHDNPNWEVRWTAYWKHIKHEAHNPLEAVLRVHEIRSE